MLLNKSSARWHIFAHKHCKHVIGCDRIGKCHSEQCTGCRIHRSLPKLVGVHLAKTFVALDFDPFAPIDAKQVDPFS